MTAPSWRPDIHGAADLVEEVVRIAGLDKVPSAPLPRPSGVARPVLTEGQRRARRARRTLAGRGLVEAITWSFIAPDSRQGLRRRPGGAGAGQPDLQRDVVDAAEPAAGPAGGRAEEPQSRLCRRRPVRGGTGLPRRTSPRTSSWRRRACARAPRRWLARAGIGRGQPGALTSSMPRPMFSRCWPNSASTRAKAQVVREAPAWFHPGRSAALKLGPKITLAHFGEIHPQTLKAMDVAGPSGGLRGVPRRLAAAEAQGPGQERAGGRRSAAGAARLRLRARLPRCRPPMSCEPRMAADKKLIADVSVFDLFEGTEPRREQEVAGAGGDPAAEGEDADGRRDRSRRRQDHCRGEEGDGRRDPRQVSKRCQPRRDICQRRSRFLATLSV